MDKIINASPTKYAKTNAQEARSVHKFQYLINVDFVKSDFKTSDTVPNTDGMLTILNEDKIFVGKIEVQIKTLSVKNESKPKYQCSLGFLSYCELSSLPVLLVVVSKNLDVAYWLHITRDVLITLSKTITGKSVSVSIPLENVVSKNSKEYIKEWNTIADNYYQRVSSSEITAKKYQEALKLIQKLETSPIESHSISPKQIHNLQRFLTAFNNYLDGPYKTIKDLYYPEFWKIGLAFTSYLPQSIAFVLYPVLNGQNDLLLREISAESPVNERGISWTYLGRENPIELNPEEYATTLIGKDVLAVIENRHLWLMTEELAMEYLVDALDDIYAMAGLRLGTNYSLKTLRERLHIFYPLWFEEYQKIKGIQQQEGRIAFIPDMSNISLLTTSEMKRISELAKRRYKRGEKPRTQIAIITGDSTDMQYTVGAFNFLWNAKAETVNRIYPRFHTCKVPTLRWQLLSPQELKSRVKNIYTLLPDIIEAFIHKYFPSLHSQIKYFHNFDKLIINVNYEKVGVLLGGSPVIEKFYFKSLNGVSEAIEVYLDGENCPVHKSKRIEYFKHGLEINGEKFKMVASSESTTSDFIKDFPLYHIAQKILKERFESYFKRASE